MVNWLLMSGREPGGSLGETAEEKEAIIEGGRRKGGVHYLQLRIAQWEKNSRPRSAKKGGEPQKTQARGERRS